MKKFLPRLSNTYQPLGSACGLRRRPIIGVSEYFAGLSSCASLGVPNASKPPSKRALLIASSFIADLTIGDYRNGLAPARYPRVQNAQLDMKILNQREVLSRWCAIVVQKLASFASQKKGGTVLFSVGKIWGGRRGLNPRHSVPQTDALPAELLPPLTDNRQFTLLFRYAKEGSIGQSCFFASSITNLNHSLVQMIWFV